MKKIKLAKCPVEFNEAVHTYKYKNIVLSGVTNIIHRYVFPDMYSNVSEEILEKARERGHAVHSDLQLNFSLGGINTPEVNEYKRLAGENGYTQIAAEYLISNLKSIATSVDSVLQLSDNEVALVDYKTTATLNIEYLQWQLSIEAELFEKQNPKLTVSKLIAVHLPKPKDGVCKGKVVEIARVNAEYVDALIKCYENDDDVFNNPLANIGEEDGEFQSLLEQYRQAEESLSEIKTTLKYYEDIETTCKARLKELMDSKSMNKWASADKSVSVTRSADSQRKTFDINLLKKESPSFPTEWLAEIESKGYKTTTIAGRVTITFK